MKKINISIYRFDFQHFKTIRSFGYSIYNGKTNIKEAEKKQKNLLKIF